MGMKAAFNFGIGKILGAGTSIWGFIYKGKKAANAAGDIAGQTTKHADDLVDAGKNAAKSTDDVSKIQPPISSGPTRSDHAQKRAMQGRPVGSALGDASRAKPSDIYIQPDGRFYITGPKGRVHIFEADGQIVTSIDSTAKATQHKLREGEIERPSNKQLERFRELFQ